MPDLEELRKSEATRGFRLGAPQQIVVTPDGKTVLFLRSMARDPAQSLYEMDLASGTEREILAPKALLAGPETLSPEERARRERMRVQHTGFTSLELSVDGTKALVTLSGRIFVFDRVAGKVHEVPSGQGAAVDPHLSPDGMLIAYVRADDLHVVPVVGGHEAAVTRGGSERVTRGLAEFVAQEELDRVRGFWWSPDGSHLLYEEADSSKVDTLTIADPMHPDRPPQSVAYPRPGRANADVRFGIVSASGGRTTWVRWDQARFPYVAQASWPKNGPPLLSVLDREQRAEQLLAVDPATGKTTPLVEEHDSAWVNADPSAPRWLSDGTGFLWSTERSGAWQLELHDVKGQLVREVLPTGFGYARLADVDEGKGTAVVIASEDPTQTVPWLVSLDGKTPPRRLTQEQEVANVKFGRAHDVYISVERTLATMSRAFVRSLDGSVGREVPSVAESPERLPVVEIAEVGPDRIRVAIVRPRRFRPGRKYAVIDAAYAGPGFVQVQRSAGAYLRAQWVADATDAIVVVIDARGTPGRGREWERAILRKLGSVPVEGHVSALQALGEKYPEMDLSRVGAYGWSFGGYFSALAVLTRPEVYKVGVAGAPPADWRDYDTVYAERYLGMPETDGAAYDAASLLTYARRPVDPAIGAGHLLVIHGVADDNVWFQNSVKLIDALERGGRQFEFMPLAGSSHMLLDADLSAAVWVRTVEVLRKGLRRPE